MMDFLLNNETPEWVNDLPTQFHATLFGVQFWQWIGLVLLLIIARLGGFLGRRIASRLVTVRDKYFPGQISPETSKDIRRASGLLTGVLVCYPFVGPMDFPSRLNHAVVLVLLAVTILAFTLLALGLWDAVCDGMTCRAAGVSERTERLLVPLTRKFVRALIVAVSVMIALSTLFSVNIMAVVASLGLGGVVVALAAKDSVENIIGSITLLFDMPFAIGDSVKIDKVEGIVEEINLRSTRIRTFEDTVINLPNANLIRASVENVSARRYRRQRLNVRIAYDTPLEKIEMFCSELNEFLTTEPRLDTERIIVKIAESDDVAITILVQCFADSDSQASELEVRHKILSEIVRLRKKHGVLFYPRGVRPLPVI